MYNGKIYNVFHENMKIDATYDKVVVEMKNSERNPTTQDFTKNICSDFDKITQ